MPFHESLLRLTRPRRLDLEVVRGDSVRLVLVIKTAEGTRVALTGLTGTALVRVGIDDPVTYPLAVAVSQSVAGLADTGEVVLTCPGSQTLMWPQVGHWGLQLQDDSPDGVVRKTLAQGRLRLVRDVVVP